MRIINLALKDLLQIARDWKATFFLFIMPIAFTLVFGFAFGGTDAVNQSEDQRIPVVLIDHDNSQLSQTLITFIDMSDSIRLEPFNEEPPLESLDKMVNDDEISAVIIIPAGYGNDLLNSGDTNLTAILKPETVTGAAIQNSLQIAVSRLEQSIESARFSTEVYEDFGHFEDGNARDGYLDEGISLAALSWKSPPISLDPTHTRSTEDVGVEETTNAFTQSSPGMMVQFALAGLIAAAEVLVFERNSGSLKRLLTTSTSRTEILIGHFAAMGTMIFVQFAILIGFAQIFLKVPYFSAPVATLLVTLATTIFTASMGLLIGTLSKTPEQVIMFSLIPMFIFSGLGGAWMPLEFTSETFQTIGHLTPLAWAMDGFQNIIIRNLGLNSAILPAAVLLGFAAVCFAFATWRFKFE